jgi:hypothetical protein
MGQEVECRMRYQERTAAGKAYLETDFVLFRGDSRLKVLLKDLTGVKAAEGVLKLEFPGGPAELELGKAAAKWAEKILHPPSRTDKLGVKRGIAVRLSGDFEPEFLDELQAQGALVMEGRAKAGLVFLKARKTADLGKVARLISGIVPDGGIWVVYPKGVQEIREVDVIHAGRMAGLKDVKVASFSATHTALKFVIPVTKR